MKAKKQIRTLTLSKRVVSKFITLKVEGGFRDTTNNTTCYHSLDTCQTRRGC